MRVLTDNQEILRQLENMHLGWFGAEEEGRTEDASDHKLKKAKEEGKVAKSQDLSSSVVLIITCLALSLLGKDLFFTMVDMVKYFLKESIEISKNRTFVAKNYEITILMYLIKVLLPIMFFSVIAGILGNVIQVGFMFAPKAIKVDFKKIVPDFIKYVKNKIFSMDAVYNLLKSILKVLVVALTAYMNIVSDMINLLKSTNVSLKSSFIELGVDILNMFFQISIVFLIMSIVDYFVQKRMFNESQRMTKQETKEERKTFEGDPLIKSRLKQRMREIMSQNISKLIPKADVLIVNPTHFAVALQYDRQTMNAPKVIAKGQDNMALKMKEIAREHKVPIMENKYLARSLYNDVDINEEISEKYYEAVVIVLREVYRIKKARG